MLITRCALRTPGECRAAGIITLLAGLVLVCVASSACATTYRNGQAITEQKRNELREALTRILDQLDLYGMPKNWQDNPAKAVLVTRSVRYNNSTYRYTVLCRVRELGRGMRMEMEPDDNKVYYLSNGIGLDKAKEDAKNNIKPSLTEKEAVEKARAYITILRGDMPENLSEPGVRYWSKDGLWNVVYCRRDNGHSWMGERLGISFSEKYGLLSFSDSRHSRVKSFDIKITQEEAFAAAKKYLPKLLKEKSYLTPNYEPIGKPKMCILAPCVFEWPDPFKAVSADWLHGGHLVYIVRMVDKTTRHWETVRVYVDAQTGEIVSDGPGAPMKRVPHDHSAPERKNEMNEEKH